MKWWKLTFRLDGAMHVGAARWGFVRTCRPYLPGWTLWGALTRFLGTRPDGPFISSHCSQPFTRAGNYLNQNFWISHFHLRLQSGEGKAAYRPRINALDGSIEYRWEWIDDTTSVHAADLFPDPLSYRHGVVRTRESAPDNLGRLFLMEAIVPSGFRSFQLAGWIGSTDASAAEVNFSTLIKPGDRLPIGGSRTSAGAELTLQKVDCVKTMPIPELQAFSHLKFSAHTPASGGLERIVMRRTLESDRNFGNHIEDWGVHLSPGWHLTAEWEGRLGPFCYADGSENPPEWRHGTLAPVPQTGQG